MISVGKRLRIAHCRVGWKKFIVIFFTLIVNLMLSHVCLASVASVFMASVEKDLLPHHVRVDSPTLADRHAILADGRPVFVEAIDPQSPTKNKMISIRSDPDESLMKASRQPLFKTFFALLCICFLIYFLAYIAKRFHFQRNTVGVEMNVLSSISVGQKEKLILMEVENEKVLIGVTPHSINFIRSFEKAAKNNALAWPEARDSDRGKVVPSDRDNNDENREGVNSQEYFKKSENRLDGRNSHIDDDFSSYLKKLIMPGIRK